LIANPQLPILNQTEMIPKSTLAFLLMLSYSALGSTTFNNRYIRQDSGRIDADCSADLNKNFAAAYPECANPASILDNMDLEYIFQYFFCEKNCGTPYLSLYFTLCPYKETLDIIEYYKGYCEVNADGRPCYSYIKHSMENEIALQLCKPSIKYNTCSAKCSSQLRAISAHYGSCTDPLFNSSYFHSADVDDLPLFSYQLWTNCGVPIPTAARRGKAKINTILY
jgi:hypothetical protein